MKEPYIDDDCGNRIKIGDRVKVTALDAGRGAILGITQGTGEVVGFGKTRVLVQFNYRTVVDRVGGELLRIVEPVDGRRLRKPSDLWAEGRRPGSNIAGHRPFAVHRGVLAILAHAFSVANNAALFDANLNGKDWPGFVHIEAAFEAAPEPIDYATALRYAPLFMLTCRMRCERDPEYRAELDAEFGSEAAWALGKLTPMVEVDMTEAEIVKAWS